MDGKRDKDDKGWKVAQCKIPTEETAAVMAIHEVQDQLSARAITLGKRLLKMMTQPLQ